MRVERFNVTGRVAPSGEEESTVVVNPIHKKIASDVTRLVPLVRGFTAGQRELPGESVPTRAINIQLDAYVVGVDHGCLRDHAADFQAIECVRIRGSAANGELWGAGFGIWPHLENEGFEAVTGRVVVRWDLADVEHQFGGVELGPRALGLDPDELAFNFEDCADHRPVGLSRVRSFAACRCGGGLFSLCGWRGSVWLLRRRGFRHDDLLSDRIDDGGLR